MSKKKKGSTSKGNDLLENPEALAEQLSRTEQFVEKNRTAVMIFGAIIALGLAGFMFSKYYLENKNVDAQRDLYQAVYYYEADSLGKALNGDGNNYGFLEIIDEYAFTKSANLANYYAGATYLKLGDFENAIRYLEEFGASDYLVQGRAYAMIGDANMELKDYAAAASYYQKAANYKANTQFSPSYLMKAAVANEQLENYQAAIGNYTAIVEDYFGASEYQEAKKQKARLEGLAN